MSNDVLKRQPLASIYNLALPIENTGNSVSRKFVSFSAKSREEIRVNQKAVTLNSQVVQTTLSNCPSDIISLSFFMWCARQHEYFHEKSAFEHLAPVVSRLIQKFSTVGGILEELKLVGCIIKPQTLLLLMRICWHGKMYDLVFEAAEEMVCRGYTPNTFAKNIVMDVLFKTEQFNAALRVLEDITAPNFLTFSIAVCNLCRLSDIVNLRNVLRKVLSNCYGLNPETFLSLLNCYCRLGRLEEALQLLCIMVTFGVPISVHTWSVLINGFCRSGQLDIAAYLLDKMASCGVSPDIVTCTSVIKGFLEADMLREAYSILSNMKSKGHYPDLVLSNVLIDCLAKVGRYEDALIVFYNLQKRRLTPDPYTFTSIMSIVCSSRLFLLLPLLINDLVIEPDLVMCNSLLSYYCKAGFPIGAVEFYNDMIDRGFTPDKYSYAGVLTGLCKLGRIHEAVNVYRGIVRGHFSHDAHIHTIIMNGLIRNGHFLKAIKLFREADAKNIQLDVVSYTVAINGLIRGGQAGEALNLLSRMKEYGVAPNMNTYSLLLGEFCKHRDFKKIKGILREMSDVGMEMDRHTFNLMKSCLCKSHTRSAFEVFVHLCESNLLPDEMHAILIDQFAHDVIADKSVHEANALKLHLDHNSDSDEFSCLAASVG